MEWDVSVLKPRIWQLNRIKIDDLQMLNVYDGR